MRSDFFRGCLGRAVEGTLGTVFFSWGKKRGHNPSGAETNDTERSRKERQRGDFAGPRGSDSGAAVMPLVPGRETAQRLEVRVP